MFNFLIQKALAGAATPAKDTCSAKYYTLRDILNNFNGTDPTKDLGSFNCFIRLISILAIDLIGVVAFIMIVYSSILYLTAYGDESKAETAKKTLTWSIVGLFLAFLSQVLVNVLREGLK